MILRETAKQTTILKEEKSLLYLLTKLVKHLLKTKMAIQLTLQLMLVM